MIINVSKVVYTYKVKEFWKEKLLQPRQELEHVQGAWHFAINKI
jgi:hypothetical protein